MAKKKSDEQILFSDVKVDDIVIKPWSFGMLFELSGLLDSVMDKAEKKGILEKVFSEDGYISYITMARVLSLASDEVLQIMATTIDKDFDTIKNFDMAKGVKIAVAIFNQNVDVIKNALSQMKTK